MVELERYKGTRSRHRCPKCGEKDTFARYVDESRNWIAEDVGRCNRESKCGYHKTPREHFMEQGITGNSFKQKKRLPVACRTELVIEKPKPFDFIALEHLKATLGSYEQNGFIQFLLNLFPDDADRVQSVLKMYLVGTFQDYTCFPYLDQLKRFCKAKLIRFDPATGKRLKGKGDTSSLKTKLNLKEDFNYKQIFFGEHLLQKLPNKPVAIVEAEKTAVIASIYFPDSIWLATGSKQWLKVERLQRFGQRKVVLYPDADGFQFWQQTATAAGRQGLSAKVSSLIENHATDEQKAEGYDLADYLINQQKEINEITENYILKAETVLNDPKLFDEFNTILQERISIIEIDGNVSRSEAVRIAITPENAKQIILSL